MGWNVQGDIAFTIDKSSRELFVNENMISKPLAGSPKNWRKLGLKSALEEEVSNVKYTGDTIH
jgi:hypothetical protein